MKPCFLFVGRVRLAGYCVLRSATASHSLPPREAPNGHKHKQQKELHWGPNGGGRDAKAKRLAS